METSLNILCSVTSQANYNILTGKQSKKTTVIENLLRSNFFFALWSNYPLFLKSEELMIKCKKEN